jgi:hypothetical protein
MKPNKTFHVTRTVTVTLMVYGIMSLHIYAILDYHAMALSLSWMVSQYIGQAN